MKLGEKTRYFRQLLGYSQQVMATSLNISHTAYAKMEREETKLTPERLQKIANVMNMNPETITEFDKNIVLNNHAEVHNFGYYQENNNQSLNESERTSYLSTIEFLKKEVEYLKDIISFQQAQIKSTFTKR